MLTSLNNKVCKIIPINKMWEHSSSTHKSPFCKSVKIFSYFTFFQEFEDNYACQCLCNVPSSRRSSVTSVKKHIYS